MKDSAALFTQAGQLHAGLSDQDMVRQLTALSYGIRSEMDVGQLATLLRKVRAGAVVLPGRNREESESLVLAAQSKVLARDRAFRRDRASKWWLIALSVGVIALIPWALPHLVDLLLG